MSTLKESAARVVKDDEEREEKDKMFFSIFKERSEISRNVDCMTSETSFRVVSSI